MISIIVAVTDGGAIGRRGDMIYHIGGDLRHFKKLTMGHPVIMGRKTFESLPNGALPGRRNIVITCAKDAVFTGAETAASLDEALQMTAGTDPFIIGGAQIYAQAMPLATDLFITEINAPAPHDADTFFPEVNRSVWHEAEPPTQWLHDDRNNVNYRFTHLVK